MTGTFIDTGMLMHHLQCILMCEKAMFSTLYELPLSMHKLRISMIFKPAAV